MKISIKNTWAGKVVELVEPLNENDFGLVKLYPASLDITEPRASEVFAMTAQAEKEIKAALVKEGCRDFFLYSFTISCSARANLKGQRKEKHADIKYAAAKLANDGLVIGRKTMVEFKLAEKNEELRKAIREHNDEVERDLVRSVKGDTFKGINSEAEGKIGDIEKEIKLLRKIISEKREAIRKLRSDALAKAVESADDFTTEQKELVMKMIENGEAFSGGLSHIFE